MARNVGLLGDILSPRVKPVTRWLGRQDSNLGMAVPKTAALPLGYAPTKTAISGHRRVKLSEFTPERKDRLYLSNSGR
jgi:hypothetical protein